MTRYPDAPESRESSDESGTPPRRKARRSARKVTVAAIEQTYGPVKLAGMLIPHLADRYRFCPELGWLRYTGAKWADTPDDAVLHELVLVVQEHGRKLIEQGPSRDAMMEMVAFSSGSTQMHAIKLARANPLIATRWDLFDRQPEKGSDEPYRFHCSNGWTIELHGDGRVVPRPTTPKDLNTKVGCAYDPAARAPKSALWWKKYQPVKEVQGFQMEMAIRGLSGMGAETFTAWYGPTAGNGKGTIEGLLQAVAGDYFLKIPVAMLLAKSRSAQNEYRNERAQLRAARLVFADEPEEGSRYDIGEVKQLTGGSAITARENFKLPITFTPRIVLTIVSNNRPAWGGDAGMERRYIEMEWAYKIPEAAKRENFKDEIAAEASGVLNRLIKMWPGATPIVIPDVIKEQTEKAKRASDLVARFVDEAIEPTEDDTKRVRTTEVYGGYAEWCRQNGERAFSSTRFGERMVKLGHERIRSNGMWYVGIQVIEDYRPRMAGF